MGTKSNFKVVIAGGSITGLTLANVLQHYGIDFVLLEAWHEMTPQVGASLGLLPHGNRILDQLGLYDKILELCPPLESFHFRNSTGNIICEFCGMDKSMHERHGYPITFLERQMALKVLYDNIKDKSKVLIEKRVQDVKLSDSGVTVRTSDGSSYSGDILVGADGIHSTVRSEMWRIANIEQPGWIPADEKDCVPCDYGCVFGISNSCEGIKPGTFNSIFRKHQSYLVIGGPKGRVYWFFFFKLPQRAYGDSIPTYTEEDLQRVLKEQENDNITPTLKFKTMLERKISSVLVPLQEYVFRKWHYQRIMTIGDAAHKIHPITGHGGNACIESAATLVNGLVKLLDSKPGAKPSLDQINNLFAETQQIRHDRATTIKCHSHNQQRTERLDTPFHELLALQILPRSDVEDVTFNFSRNMPLAEKLHSIHIAPKHRLVPYKDELFRTPTPRGAVKWYFFFFYLLVAALTYYGMWVHSAHWGLGTHLGSILMTGKFEHDPSFDLKRQYTGIAFLDNYLVFLAAIFTTGVTGWDPQFATQQRYFLYGLIQPIAVWAVESYRKRNKLTPVALYTLFLTITQWAGVGIFMPIYYALYTLVSEPETYWWPLNRENFETFWQPSPMFIVPICTVLGFLYARRHNIKNVTRKANVPFPDVPHLQTLYLYTAAIGLVTHVWIIMDIMASDKLTFASVFWPNLAATQREIGDGLTQLFLVDFWGLQIGSYGWLCMAVWDLKRVGRTNVDVKKAAALIAVSCVIIGPGTTMSLVWYWRESALTKTTFAKELT